jgi:hypothetical protein
MKTSFKFKDDNLEYVIKVYKRNYLWWLLLLLLPLILLIRFEKTIYVKTVDSNTNKVFPSADVKLDYVKSYLYSNSAFFLNDTVSIIKKSNSSGIAEFKGIKTSIYSYIFNHFTEINIQGNGACWQTDTVNKQLHYTHSGDTVLLKFKSKLVQHPIEFQVIDTEDNQPLPESNVTIFSEINGYQYIDSGKTNTNGSVYFKNIPECGKINLVKATLDGYVSDSIVNKSDSKLLSKAKDRIIKLKPIKGTYSFFIIDCRTKQGIPNAKVKVDVENGLKKTTKLKYTNVNGVGKGFDSDWEKAKIHLSASAPYYKNGELVGWHLIRDFIDIRKFQNEKRTICLEPNPNAVVFKNIDSLSGLPLAGVKNIIKIKNNTGESTEEVFSASDGNFPVNISIGDIFSISSFFDPDYSANSHTILNKNAIDFIKNTNNNDRVIPLKPKMVKLLFNTTEKDENGNLLPNVDVVITVDNVKYNPTNSGSGSFETEVPITGKISIVASKAKYTTNSNKIQDEKVSEIILEPQEKRNIPLIAEEDPCNVEDNSDGKCCGERDHNFSLGNQKKVIVVFYHNGIGDEFWIYSGKGRDPNKLLYHSGEYLNLRCSKKDTQFIDFSMFGDNEITVTVNVKDTGSSYRIKVSCPK